MTLPEQSWKLERISPRAYQHPADRAATAALQKIPYLDQVVRQLISLGYERALRAASLGASVRLGQEQLPGIWVLHRQVFNTLDIEEVPDLYMTQFPIANAFTFGSGKPVVVMASELVRILDDDGRRVVLAHEAAHVHSDHVLYRTALAILLRLGGAVRLPLLAGLPLLAITLALLEWSRAAELSCDRAAALVTRDPQAVCKALMVIAAGESADQLNLDAFIAQGMDYSERGTGIERLTRLFQDLRITHPMPVRRANAARLGARGRLRPHGPRRVPSPRRRALRARGGRRGRRPLHGPHLRRDPERRLLGVGGRRPAADWLKRTRNRDDDPFSGGRGARSCAPPAPPSAGRPPPRSRCSRRGAARCGARRPSAGPGAPGARPCRPAR